MTEMELKFIDEVEKKNWTFDFKEWKKFPTTPQTREDLILRALCGTNEGKALVKRFFNLDSTDCLCYTFACASQYMDDDTVKELAFIGSPFFSFSIYEKKYIDVIYEILKGKFGNVDKYLSDSLFDSREINFINRLRRIGLTNSSNKIDYVSLSMNSDTHFSEEFLKENKEHIGNEIKGKNTPIAIKGGLLSE